MTENDMLKVVAGNRRRLLVIVTMPLALAISASIGKVDEAESAQSRFFAAEPREWRLQVSISGKKGGDFELDHEGTVRAYIGAWKEFPDTVPADERRQILFQAAELVEKVQFRPKPVVEVRQPVRAVISIIFRNRRIEVSETEIDRNQAIELVGPKLIERLNAYLPEKGRFSLER